MVRLRGCVEQTRVLAFYLVIQNLTKKNKRTKKEQKKKFGNKKENTIRKKELPVLIDKDDSEKVSVKPQDNGPV